MVDFSVAKCTFVIRPSLICREIFDLQKKKKIPTGRA
jgi:hypothetical protein